MYSDNSSQKKPLFSKGTKRLILFLVIVFGTLFVYHVFVSPMSVNSAGMTISYNTASADDMEYFSNSNIKELPTENAGDYIVAKYNVKIANLGLFNINSCDININTIPQEFIAVKSSNEIFPLKALKNDVITIGVLVYVGDTNEEKISTILKSIEFQMNYDISILGNRSASININRTLTPKDNTTQSEKPAQ